MRKIIRRYMEVFNSETCIFMAPPARLVPQLMDDLLVGYFIMNLIRMTIPDKPNSKNQRYVKV